jgi:hypothetical protein
MTFPAVVTIIEQPDVEELQECVVPGCNSMAGPSGLCVDHTIKSDPGEFDHGDDERRAAQGE